MGDKVPLVMSDEMPEAPRPRTVVYVGDRDVYQRWDGRQWSEVVWDAVAKAWCEL